jgi:hypothetical protein
VKAIPGESHSRWKPRFGSGVTAKFKTQVYKKVPKIQALSSSGF